MSDTFEHNPGDHEDPLSGPTWIVGFLGAVLLAVIILGITALYYNANHQEFVRKVVDRDPHELDKLRAEQLAQLEGPIRYVEVMEKNDKGDDVLVKSLVIPISEAMQRVVADGSNAPAKSGG